jgi:integrase
MEYLQQPEVRALLNISYGYGNREAHLALLVMYATGTRVSQVVGDAYAKKPIEDLKGVDIIPDTNTGGHMIRIRAVKRGETRRFRVLVSPNPALDMRDLVTLAAERGTGSLFGGLTRHYLHTLIKKFAKMAGLHEGMVHCHNVRHSTAMRIMEKTGRIGAVSGYLCHSDLASAFPYLQENDTKFADNAMTAVFAEG